MKNSGKGTRKCSDKGSVHHESEVPVAQLRSQQLPAVDGTNSIGDVANPEGRVFVSHLADLVEVSNELSILDSIDDLCREAVELGRSRFGFDRISLFFFDSENSCAHGSYGINAKGALVDLHDFSFEAKQEELQRDSQSIAVHQDVALKDRKDTVGRGTTISATFRDRDRAVGAFYVDNLFSQEPITRYQCELLRLYALSFGSLYASRIRENEFRRVHGIYCSAIENISGVPYRLNHTTGEYDFVGEGLVRLLGIPASEMSKARLRSIILENIPTDSSDYEDADERGLALLRGESSRYRADILVRTPNGEEKWISDYSVPIQDEKTGEVIASLGILQDITERKRSEEEFKRAHEVYCEAIENAQGVPYQFDFATQRYDFVGQGCKSLLGIAAEELTLQKFREIALENLSVEGDPSLDNQERASRFISGDIARYRADIRIRAASGEEKWITDCSVPIRDKVTGEVIGSLGILQDITDRRRHEDQIRSAHQAYCEAIENAQGVPYRLNYKTGQYEFVGEACERIIGVPSSEMTSKRFREMAVENIPTDTGYPTDAVERDELFRKGEMRRYRADVRIITPKGEEKWLTDCSVPIRDGATGEITGSLGILMDITERKRQEQQLLKAHQTYCEAIDNAQGVPYRLNYGTGQYEFVGEGCERIVGIPASEMTAKRLREMVIENIPTNPEDPEDPKVRDRLFREGKLPRYRSDIRIKTPQGEEKWLMDCSVPIVDERSGEITGSLGILMDITERKHQEEKIQETSRTYCEAIENAQGVPYRLNYLTGQYEFVGDGCERILGIPSDHLTAKRFREMAQENIPTDTGYPADAVERDRLFRKGEMRRYRADVRILTPTGEEKWLTDCSVPIRDSVTGEITRSLGILQDITERKKAEQSLRVTSRMEATTTLAGGVAHDFNNLMVAVLGNAELLRMQFFGSREALEMIDSIAQAAQRAGDLAQQMLAFARGGKYELRVLNLNEVVKQTLQLQSRAFPPRITIEKDIEPDLCNIEADPAQMSQIIMNLCINAVEAIEGNGSITITTRNIQIEPDEHYHGVRPGRYVYLSVQDTGRGMTPEIKTHVFEPFYTTKFQGRGLGLAAVYGIVMNHGGDILVYSEPGRGTTFKVYLPATSATIRKVAEPKTENLTGTETILMIDDEEAVIDVTRRILVRLGYSVLVARNGREAVEIAQEFAGEIHLALLDMGMPIMGGSETFPLLRESRPKIRVLICSGYELDASSQALLDAGADGFVQKPFQLRTLGMQIRHALDQ